MEQRSFITPFKVGLVILAGIVVAIVMITRVGSQWGDADKTYSVVAYFDDVTGLAERSQVRIAGIAVGEVTRIELVDSRARVTLVVRDDITLFEGIPQPDGYYRGGATISKKLSSLLGDYYLEVTPGIEGRELGNGDEIKNVIQGGGPDAIMAQVEQITRDIAEVTDSLARVFGGDEGRARIDAILRDVEDVTRTIRDLTVSNSERLDQIVENVERLTAEARVILARGGNDVDVIMRDLRAAASDLRETMGVARGGVDTVIVRVEQVADTTQQAAEKLDRALANIETVTAGLAEGEGTAGKILRDPTIANETEALLKETRGLIASAKQVADDVGEITGSIGSLETVVDLRNDYMVGFNAFKNVLRVRLQPRPEKWYDIELVRDPRGKTNVVRRAIDSTTNEPVYEEVTETTSDFKFSFQFAGRWEFLAGRFGIIESTGGLGANVYLFDDNLEFVVDVFDFGFGPAPRVRAFGQLYFDLFLPWTWSENLYLSGGIDDPFNAGTFDGFVGIGLTFNDRDLKGLLTVAPTPSP